MHNGVLMKSSHISGKITNGYETIIVGFTCTKILSVHSNSFIKPAQLCIVKVIVLVCSEETKLGRGQKEEK